MRTSSRLCAALLSTLTLCSLGCGDDGDADSGGSVMFSADTTCGLALRTRGAVALNLGPSSGPGCLVENSSGLGIDASFYFADRDDISAAELQLPGIAEGETGSQWAVFGFAAPERQQWVAEECEAKVTKHEYVGPGELGSKVYRLEGSLHCADPALPDSDETTGSVEIASMSFVLTVSWMPQE
ncbi:MAG: hypothetical protein QM778_29215 [Myxococcales bacterium]